MAIPRMLDLPPMTLVATSTTEVFIPAGEWQSSVGIVSAKAWGELRGLNGAAQARPAVQLANDTRSPDAAIGIGTALASNGMFDPATASVSTGSKQSIRPGWLVSLSGGSTLATVSVIGTLVLES